MRHVDLDAMARVVGFGEVAVTPPAKEKDSNSEWKIVLLTSVLSAATTILIDEIIQSIRGKRR